MDRSADDNYFLNVLKDLMNCILEDDGWEEYKVSDKEPLKVSDKEPNENIHLCVLEDGTKVYFTDEMESGEYIDFFEPTEVVEKELDNGKKGFQIVSSYS